MMRVISFVSYVCSKFFESIKSFNFVAVLHFHNHIVIQKYYLQVNEAKILNVKDFFFD